MFSNLRQGSQIYVFHKCASTPYIEMGSVENTNQYGSFYQPLPGMPMNFSIRMGDKVTPCPNLPPNAEIADVTNNQTGETITLACTKEALNAEIESMKQKSIEAINSVDYHRQRISAYDALLNQLNPEQVEKAAQAQEMASMRQQMAQMARAIAQLTSKLGGEGASSSADGEPSGTVTKTKKGE